jgi:carboxylesterase
MDARKTAAFELGTGEDACLLLHGFTGSPWEMRPVGEALAARGLHVRAIQLPGHGTTPEALLDVTHRDWLLAATQALSALRHHRRVFVAGLSMGALLALELAARHPEHVQGLALMAPAIHFAGVHMWLLKRLRRHALLERFKPWILKKTCDLSCPVALAEAPLLASFPSARLQCLWELQDLALAALPQVRCPTFVATSRQDHVVDPEGGALIVRGLTAAPLVRTLQLDTGYHIMPRDVGAPRLLAELGDFFDRLRSADAPAEHAAG